MSPYIKEVVRTLTFELQGVALQGPEQRSNSFKITFNISIYLALKHLCLLYVTETFTRLWSP